MNLKDRALQGAFFQGTGNREHSPNTARKGQIPTFEVHWAFDITKIWPRSSSEWSDRFKNYGAFHSRLAGRHSAVMLANHGPVVASKSLEASCNAIEELESTARLALLTRGLSPRILTAMQIEAVVTKFDVEWD